MWLTAGPKQDDWIHVQHNPWITHTNANTGTNAHTNKKKYQTCGQSLPLTLNANLMCKQRYITLHIKTPLKTDQK